MMKKTISALCAAAVTVATLGATMLPAEAAGMQTYHSQSYQSRSSHDDRQHAKPRFEKHGSYAMYNGHKGYKSRHAGYKYYNGYWFPPAAFVAGAIIGGFLSQIHHN